MAERDLFAEERRERILTIAEQESRVTVVDLAERFQVSGDTIRRDLRQLEQLGLIRKTYGGALRHVATTAPYERRAAQASDIKTSIGCRAAELVSERDTLIIHSGTTTLELARALKTPNVRVLTNDLEVARVISAKGYHLTLLGGRWDAAHHELLGPTTVEQISRYRVDKAFLGIAALEAKHGWTDISEEGAAVKQAVLRVAEQVIGLADHTKIGKVAFARVADASAFDVLITDELADCDPFEDVGWTLIKVAAGQLVRETAQAPG